MKVLVNNAKSKTVVKQFTRTDGQVLYLTGEYSSNGRYLRYQTQDNMFEGVHNQLDRLRDVPNFIFSAKLEFINSEQVKDVESGMIYNLTTGARLKFLEAFIQNRISSDQKVISGYFTFIKEGSTASVIPYLGSYSIIPRLDKPALPDEVPEDAIDEIEVLQSFKGLG